jgi:hypothetical protein
MPVLRAAPRAEGSHGYLVSSFELRAGLEVTALAVTSLPAEVLRELQRLRQSWDMPAPRALPALR